MDLDFHPSIGFCYRFSLNWLMRIVCLMAALLNASSGRYPLDDPKKDDAFTNGTYLYGNEMIYHFRFYI